MSSCSWPHLPSGGHPLLITTVKQITDRASCLLRVISSGKLRKLASELRKFFPYEPLIPFNPNPPSCPRAGARGQLYAFLHSYPTLGAKTWTPEPTIPHQLGQGCPSFNQSPNLRAVTESGQGLFRVHN